MQRNPRFGWVLLGALAALAPSTAQAQSTLPGGTTDNTAFGTTSAEFLLLGGGARGVGLGPSYAAIATDASALYYNPAGAALGTRPSLVVGTYDYVADTRYSWGGIAFPFGGGSQVFGAQIGTFGFKDQPVYTVDQPNGTGATYSVNETFVGLTYGQRFSDRFSAGLTAKGVFDQLGSVSGKAFAIDFGTMFQSNLSNHGIKLGFTLQNLGTTLSYSGADLNRAIPRDSTGGGGSEPAPVSLKTKGFQLPTIFQVSLAYDLLSNNNKQHKVTVIGSFNQANNNRAGFGFAGEWSAHRLGGSPFGAALRGSYSWAPANNTGPTSQFKTGLSDEENLQGSAGGGGLFYETGNFLVGVDYAFKYMGILGPTHFVSLSLGW
jgi:hypothetical protein